MSQSLVRKVIPQAARSAWALTAELPRSVESEVLMAARPHVALRSDPMVDSPPLVRREAPTAARQLAVSLQHQQAWQQASRV